LGEVFEQTEIRGGLFLPRHTNRVVMSQPSRKRPAAPSVERETRKWRKVSCSARVAAYNPAIAQLAQAAADLQQARTRHVEAERELDLAYRRFAARICTVARELYDFEVQKPDV
jgi:hypothetical protein